MACTRDTKLRRKTSLPSRMVVRALQARMLPYRCGSLRIWGSQMAQPTREANRAKEVNQRSDFDTRRKSVLLSLPPSSSVCVFLVLSIVYFRACRAARVVSLSSSISISLFLRHLRPSPAAGRSCIPFPLSITHLNHSYKSRISHAQSPRLLSSSSLLISRTINPPRQQLPLAPFIRSAAAPRPYLYTHTCI